MAIRPRSDGFQVDVKFRGKRIRAQAPDIAKAQALEAEIKSDLMNHGEWRQVGHTGAPQPSMERLKLRHWIDVCYSDPGSWCDQSAGLTQLKNAEDCLAILGLSFRVADVDHVALLKVKGALRDAGLTNATIQRKLSALSRVLTYAENANAILKKPKISRIKEKGGRIRVISPEEEQAILAYFVDRRDLDMHDLVCVLLDTGCRLREVLQALRGKDIQPGQVTIWESKADNPGTVPLFERSQVILDRRKGEHGPGSNPFPDLTAYASEKRWSRMRNDLGHENDKQFVMHALRHTRATRLVEAGVHSEEIQAWLRHRSFATTQKYLHLRPAGLLATRDRLQQIASTGG